MTDPRLTAQCVVDEIDARQKPWAAHWWTAVQRADGWHVTGRNGPGLTLADLRVAPDGITGTITSGAPISRDWVEEAIAACLREGLMTPAVLDRPSINPREAAP